MSRNNNHCRLTLLYANSIHNLHEVELMTILNNNVVSKSLVHFAIPHGWCKYQKCHQFWGFYDRPWIFCLLSISYDTIFPFWASLTFTPQVWLGNLRGYYYVDLGRSLPICTLYMSMILWLLTKFELCSKCMYG